MMQVYIVGECLFNIAAGGHKWHKVMGTESCWLIWRQQWCDKKLFNYCKQVYDKEEEAHSVEKEKVIGKAWSSVKKVADKAICKWDKPIYND